MKRRNFLKGLGAGAVAVAAPWGAVQAADDAYEGPLLITVNALGGWDVTNFIDPKGNHLNRRYDVGDVETAGRIAYAPLDSNGAFLQRHHGEMLVINGIDMATGGHVEGARHAWSGDLADNGTPSLAALFAAAKTRELNLPAPFISYGGFSRTGDLVPLTRLANPAVLQSIGNPATERGFPGSARYVDDFVVEEIYRARRARHERQLALETLPRFKAQRSTLFAAQLSAPALRRYQDFLPTEDETRGFSNWQTSAVVTLAAMKAGIAASASVYVSDFDTHSDHENRHQVKLEELLAAITTLIDRADQLDLLDRLTLVISSEFSRTPEYNGSGGKDHWPVNSMILMGPGIDGNRVVGSTDDAHLPRSLDLDTLEPNDGGERLRPAHLHSTLREHLGIAEFGVASGFDLRTRTLPLLRS
ncbi:MAG: DUF1501 domain-containing protein [Myxococcota bacterium]